MPVKYIYIYNYYDFLLFKLKKFYLNINVHALSFSQLAIIDVSIYYIYGVFHLILVI